MHVKLSKIIAQTLFLNNNDICKRIWFKQYCDLHKYYEDTDPDNEFRLLPFYLAIFGEYNLLKHFGEYGGYMALINDDLDEFKKYPNIPDYVMYAIILLHGSEKIMDQIDDFDWFDECWIQDILELFMQISFDLYIRVRTNTNKLMQKIKI